MAKSSPTSGKRGCLCPDGKYSAECCNGELQNQGVGSTVEQSTSTIININEERIITNES